MYSVEGYSLITIGAPVSAIVEETEMPRSTLYEKFDKYDEGEINIETVEEPFQTCPPKSIAVQATPITVPETSKIETPKEFDILGEISKWADGILT